MTDYLDRLIEGDSAAPDVIGGNGKGMFGPLLLVMAVGRRASCSAEIDEIERAYLDDLQLPLPWWDEDGNLEPLSHLDFQMLKSAGVTPEEWELLVLEDHFATRKETT
jgi:hypothetical protein